MQKLTEIQHSKRAYSKATAQRENGSIQPTDSKTAHGVGRLLTYQLWKGVIDRLLALLALVVLSPILIIIALAVRLDSAGNPLFRQERIGKEGRTFIAYKFRTMHINNDDSEYKAYLGRYILENTPYQIDEVGQPVFKVVNDARVTRVGSLLRRTNLDELPQLLNILQGEMSLVGPRPEVSFALSMYKQRQRERFTVKPGITGLWQVCGRKNLSFKDMIRLDLEYIERQSLLFDIKILLLTVRTVVRKDGS